MAGAALILRAGGALPANGKKPHAAVAYQDRPKGNKRCEIRTSVPPPDQCRTVVGPVGREGWRNIDTVPA